MCAVLAIISSWNANRNTEVKSRHDLGIPKAWCSEQSPLGDGSTDWSEHTESLSYRKPSRRNRYPATLGQQSEHRD